MGIAETPERGQLRVLERLSVPVSIGVDTFSHGRIRARTTEAVLRTLTDFAAVLRDFGIERRACRVVATTAVRDARNREVFLDRVDQRTGFRIEVLEAIEETRLVHQLAASLLGERYARGNVMLLALGAGGTQIIVQHDGELRLAETRDFGTLRLLESEGGDAVAAGSMRRLLSKEVDAIGRLHDLSTVEQVVLINDELLQLLERMGSCQPDHVGMTATRHTVLEVADRVSELTPQQLTEEVGLPGGSPDVARIAFEEARAFIAPTAASQILLPRCSNVDSLLLDCRLRAAGPPRTHGPSAVEAAAWALARKYRVDEAHTAKVQQLALQLYVGLAQFAGLSDDARKLLSVAAILHNVGIYVRARGHAEHSAYIIANSEVMGLRQPELERVALIVRHHRRSFRDRDLEGLELGSLSAGQRVEVLKLVALLRIADALDADHRQLVDRVEVDVGDDHLDVLAATRGGGRDSFEQIRRAFDRQSDLFSELFGLRPELTEMLA